MPKIIQLSPHIANLIAAGEVVERPASVAKELLENAVDAGATKVTIEIRNGGMTFLRVTDNGCGMTAEDARRAFLRHATSKLRTAEDLAVIGTMGFRGEALAAIASVSRVDLMTKPSEDLTGISLHLEGGEITEETEAGCPDGTTIIIRDLFYNTPARMKFMKADTVEGARVTAAVQLQLRADIHDLPDERAVQLQNQIQLRDECRILPKAVQHIMLAAAWAVYIPEGVPGEGFDRPVFLGSFVSDMPIDLVHGVFLLCCRGVGYGHPIAYSSGPGDIPFRRQGVLAGGQSDAGRKLRSGSGGCAGLWCGGVWGRCAAAAGQHPPAALF